VKNVIVCIECRTLRSINLDVAEVDEMMGFGQRSRISVRAVVGVRQIYPTSSALQVGSSSDYYLLELKDAAN